MTASPPLDPSDQPPGEPGQQPAVRWLAGMALQGLISRRGVPDSEASREEFALWSYRMAQSMLVVESELHAVKGKQK